MYTVKYGDQIISFESLGQLIGWLAEQLINDAPQLKPNETFLSFEVTKE